MAINILNRKIEEGGGEGRGERGEGRGERGEGRGERERGEGRGERGKMPHTSPSVDATGMQESLLS